MAFLSINSWVLPVFSGAATSITKLEIGRRSQGHRGLAKKSIRSNYRNFDLSTTLLTRAKAVALTHLIHGEGHVFNFNNDMVAGSSLQPKTGDIAIAPTGGATLGALAIRDFSFFVVDAQLTGDWFIMVRKFINATSTWEMQAITSNGVTWRAGISGSDPGIITTLVVSAGILYLMGTDDAGTNTALALFDELVILPWIPTDDMIAAWTTQSEPFSQMPVLSIQGDMANCNIIGTVLDSNHENGAVPRETLTLNFVEVK